jgi:hypothetical protein
MLHLARTRAGRICAVARTRKESVADVKRKRPGLILADIQLTDGSSGLDTVNEILEAMDVPVVFVTPHPERLLTGERPEPAFLITKPFSPDTVKALIGQALFFDVNARAPRKSAASACPDAPRPLTGARKHARPYRPLVEELSAGQDLIFPDRDTGRVMSENRFLVARDALGYSKEQCTPHGFRSSFRDWAAEETRAFLPRWLRWRSPTKSRAKSRPPTGADSCRPSARSSWRRGRPTSLPAGERDGALEARLCPLICLVNRTDSRACLAAAPTMRGQSDLRGE